MPTQPSEKRDFERVAQIVLDAGGRVVGRTKLQKIAYFLEATGLGDGFTFEYRHYGPYSEDLTGASRIARMFGVLTEEEHATNWGGFYSIYTVQGPTSGETARTRIARIAAAADPIELELAATAAFLASEGNNDPWGETARRKPEKASSARLVGAKALYRQLRKITTPRDLPAIV